MADVFPGRDGQRTLFVRQRLSASDPWRKSAPSIGASDATSSGSRSAAGCRQRAEQGAPGRSVSAVAGYTTGPTSWPSQNGQWIHRSGPAPYQKDVDAKHRHLPKVLQARLGGWRPSRATGKGPGALTPSATAPDLCPLKPHFRDGRGAEEDLANRIKALESIFAVQQENMPLAMYMSPRIEELAKPRNALAPPQGVELPSKQLRPLEDAQKKKLKKRTPASASNLEGDPLDDLDRLLAKQASAALSRKDKPTTPEPSKKPTRSEKMLAEEPAERPLASGSQAGLQRGKSTASDASQPAKKSREQSGVLRNESNASASGYGGATEPQRGNSSASFGGHGRAEQPAGLQCVKSTSSTAGSYAAEQPPGVQRGKSSSEMSQTPKKAASQPANRSVDKPTELNRGESSLSQGGQSPKKSAELPAGLKRGDSSMSQGGQSPKKSGDQPAEVRRGASSMSHGGQSPKKTADQLADVKRGASSMSQGGQSPKKPAEQLVEVKRSGSNSATSPTATKKSELQRGESSMDNSQTIPSAKKEPAVAPILPSEPLEKVESSSSQASPGAKKSASTLQPIASGISEAAKNSAHEEQLDRQGQVPESYAKAVVEGKVGVLPEEDMAEEPWEKDAILAADEAANSPAEAADTGRSDSNLVGSDSPTVSRLKSRGAESDTFEDDFEDYSQPPSAATLDTKVTSGRPKSPLDPLEASEDPFERSAATPTVSKKDKEEELDEFEVSGDVKTPKAATPKTNGEEDFEKEGSASQTAKQDTPVAAADEPQDTPRTRAATTKIQSRVRGRNARRKAAEKKVAKAQTAGIGGPRSPAKTGESPVMVGSMNDDEDVEDSDFEEEDAESEDDPLVKTSSKMTGSVEYEEDFAEDDDDEVSMTGGTPPSADRKGLLPESYAKDVIDGKAHAAPNTEGSKQEKADAEEYEEEFDDEEDRMPLCE